MKISIITATYNSSSTIGDCISSVNNQTYPDIEHIFIDGASIDNTLSIINSVSNRVNKIISERDGGIYDAMNKGISLATGEIVGLLNSDDLYLDNYSIERIVEVFDKSKTSCVYGDLYYVDKYDVNRIVRHWRTGRYKQGAFKKGWHPAHPTFFIRKNIYDLYGKFDLSFALAADFEFMLRIMERYQISSEYLPLPLVKMRLGGKTNKSLHNIYLQNIECINAFKKNGLDAGPFYTIYRLIPKLKQFFV